MTTQSAALRNVKSERLASDDDRIASLPAAYECRRRDEVNPAQRDAPTVPAFATTARESERGALGHAVLRAAAYLARAIAFLFSLFVSSSICAAISTTAREINVGSKQPGSNFAAR